MKILVLNNVFKKNLAPDEIDPCPLGCQMDNQTINFERLTIRYDRGQQRNKICDLSAQCGTICHVKLEQVYKLISIQ